MPRVRSLYRILLSIAICANGSGAARAAAPIVVVIELFTSEGCSSCPPADTLLRRLADAPPVDGVQIVALGEHVDYWDHQGWKDRFSSAALTSRQRGYAQAFNTENIYTPQMVVDGQVEFVGSDAAAARRAIAQAVAAPRGRVQLSIEPAPAGEDARHKPSRYLVGVTALDLPKPPKGDRDEIVVAVTEERLQSDVRRGENKGRVLAHAAVVRDLRAIGDAAGQPVRSTITIDPSWNRANLTIVAFVQQSRSRRIVAAASSPLEGARR